jgi:serine/threonine protein kinase
LDETLASTPQGANATDDSAPTSHPSREAAPADYAFLAPPQAPDELGRLGNYRVLKVLGMGGMGIVFEAEDMTLMRRVALKAMKPVMAVTPEHRQRFLREAQLTAAIEHDHIVTIYQVGEDRDVPYLAMKLLQGQSLEERLRDEGGWLQLPEVLRIGKEITEGLAAAHDRDLIHRDIKPANIWLESPKDRVKIVDFGLARASTGDARITQTGAVMGTPQYMAPEQANGDPVNHKCDLFSLGCVLYRLSTGQLPFKGKDTMSTLMALASKTPEAPHDIEPDLPQALSDLIMHLLAKDPDDRPKSAEDVLHELEDIETALTDADRNRPAPAVRRKQMEDEESLFELVTDGDEVEQAGAQVVDDVEVIDDDEVKAAPRKKRKKGDSQPPRRKEKRPGTRQKEGSSERTVIILGIVVAVLIALLLAFLFIRRHIQSKEASRAPAASPALVQREGPARPPVFTPLAVWFTLAGKGLTGPDCHAATLLRPAVTKWAKPTPWRGLHKATALVICQKPADQRKTNDHGRVDHRLEGASADEHVIFRCLPISSILPAARSAFKAKNSPVSFSSAWS